MARIAKIPEGCRLRSDGRLEKRFTYNGHRYSVYGSSKKEIEQNERNLKDEVDQGIVRSVMTLNAYFDKWCLIREGDPQIKPATIYTDRRRYKKIAPILGAKKVRDIRKDHIKEMMIQLHAKGVSSKGIKDTLSLLSSIMNDAAYSTEIIPKNPCKGIRPPERTRSENKNLKQKHRWLKDEEICIFFKYAEGSFYCNLFELLLHTGMRCGEACALTWGDIDYDAEKIHITKTVTRVDDRTFTIGEPKTKDSVRDNELTPYIITILKRQRRQMVDFFGLYAGASDQLIFTTMSHDLIKQSNISPTIRNICRKATEAGEIIEVFTSHSFRDTYISYQVNVLGTPMAAVAKQVGHHDISVIIKYYLKEDETQVREAARTISLSFETMLQAQ